MGVEAPLRIGIAGMDAAFWPGAFTDVAREAGAQVDFCCDLGLAPDEVRADLFESPGEFAAERELELVHDLDEMLAQVDAVFVCSRNTRMPDVAVRAIEAGRPAYVAKPIGLSGAAVRRVLDAARTHGVLVTAGQLASTWQPFPALLDVVASGEVGDVVTMHVMHQHGRFADFPDVLWYTDPREGDAVNWLGWYPAEAVITTMGPVARVSGTGRAALARFADMPDVVAGTFELADGRIATAVIWYVVPTSWPLPMHEAEIVGTEGVARCHGPAPEVQVLGAGGERRIPFEPGDGIRPEVRRFLAAVRGDGTPAITLERAVHVAEVCAAWRESVGAGGAPVGVPPAP